MSKAEFTRVPVWPAGEDGCTCPYPQCKQKAGRHPKVKWSQVKPGDTFPDDMWVGANTAVLTGARSGVWVLDIDTKGDAGGLEAVQDMLDWLGIDDDRAGYVVGTPSGGWHLYYRAPEGDECPGVSTGLLGPGLDVRGEGGLVMAPPTRGYQVVDEGEIADAPPDLVRAAAIAPFILTKLAGHAGLKNGVISGGRNDALVRWLGHLWNRKDLSPGLVRFFAHRANDMYLKPPLDRDEVDRTVDGFVQRGYDRGEETPTAGEVDEDLVIRQNQNSSGHVDILVEGLARHGDVYVKPGSGLCIFTTESGFIPLTKDALWAVAGKVCRWEAWDAKTKLWKPSTPFKDVVRAAADHGIWPGVPRVQGVVDRPWFDGEKIISSPEESLKHGLLYQGGFELPQVGSWEESLVALLDLVDDFEFEADIDKAAWLALVLTLVAKRGIEGDYPGFFMDSSYPGAGKDLLARVALEVAGIHASPGVLPSTEEEIEKRLVAMALQGYDVAYFSNFRGVLKSRSLESAMTGGRRVEGRVLGKSQMRQFPWDGVVLVTGNQAQLNEDMVRRMLTVRLSPSERPGMRVRGWKYPDLLKTVRENAGELYAHALNLLVNGPKAEWDGLAMAGFEGWERVVRSAVVGVTGVDPVGDAGRRDDIAGIEDETEAVEAVIAQWLHAGGSEGRTADEAIAEVMGNFALRDALDDGKVNLRSPRSVCWRLKRFKGRIATIQGQRYRIMSFKLAHQPRKFAVQPVR